VGGGSGYLSSTITDRTGAGSAGCPWLLRASPWQRINVTLIDFSDAEAGHDAVGYSIVLGETAGGTGQGPHHRRHDVEEPYPADDVDEDPGEVDFRPWRREDSSSSTEVYTGWCTKK